MLNALITLRAYNKIIGSFCAFSRRLNSKKAENDNCETFTITFGNNMLKHQVEIEYCIQCRWLLRAAWLAQELLTTFEADLAGVNLMPGTGGVLEVRLNGALLFSRKQAGRFPESKELKQMIRDVISPERDLGHSDKQVHSEK